MVSLRSFHDPVALISAIPISLVVLVGAVLSVRSHGLLRQDRDLVVHTYQVISSTQRLLLAMSDAETGQRGFLITNDRSFLQPYEKATAITVPRLLRSLEKLVADNPEQIRRSEELRNLLQRKFGELATTVAVRREKGFPAASTIVLQRTGKDIMDRIRGVTEAIEAAERRLLERRSKQVEEDERQILMVAIGTTIFSTLLRIAIAFGRQRLLRWVGDAKVMDG